MLTQAGRLFIINFMWWFGFGDCLDRRDMNEKAQDLMAAERSEFEIARELRFFAALHCVNNWVRHHFILKTRKLSENN